MPRCWKNLTEHMSVSAEIDAAAGLRSALKRYALDLRAYLQRRRRESSSCLKDLQRLADQMAE